MGITLKDFNKYKNDASLYSGLNEKNKRKFWEYGTNQGLVPMHLLNDQMKTEVAKYTTGKFDPKQLQKSTGRFTELGEPILKPQAKDKFSGDVVKGFVSKGVPITTKQLADRAEQRDSGIDSTKDQATPIIGKRNLPQIKPKIDSDVQKRTGKLSGTQIKETELVKKPTALAVARETMTPQLPKFQGQKITGTLGLDSKHPEQRAEEARVEKFRIDAGLTDSLKVAQAKVEGQESEVRQRQAKGRLTAIENEVRDILRVAKTKPTQEQKDKLNKLSQEMMAIQGTANPKGVAIGEALSFGMAQPILEATTKPLGLDTTQVFEDARKEKGYTSTKLITDLGMQVGMYGAVNKIIKSVSALQKFGGTMLGKQGIDLLADAIVQTPQEVLRAVRNDDTASTFVKDWVANRALDVAINGALGFLGGDFNKKVLDSPEMKEAITSVGLEPEATVRILKSGNDDAVSAIKERVDEQVRQLEDDIVYSTPEIKVPDQELRQIDDVVDSAKQIDDSIASVKPEAPKTTAAEVETPKPKTFNITEETVKGYKDLGSTERWTTDVYRNFEKTFGNDFPRIKKEVLDPFDAAKKARVEEEIVLSDALQKDIVKDLGIKPKSRESALVMRYGEKRITAEELVKEVGKEKADKIIKADDWFREKYETLIDDINATRFEMGKEPILKRDDYYRHYTDMSDTFSGIKNIFESNKLISPKLEGVSEFTKPTEKWASFKQKRTDGTKFTEDAVGGFIDYIKAGTYAKHIDPQVKQFRTFKSELANITENSKNINNFIGFLDEFTNNLAGKTNKFDRTIQDLIGRKKFAIVNSLNARVKANAVLGNASSALSQIANVPQGLAHVKNPVQLAQGMTGYLKSIFGGGDKTLYNQSGFLKERLTDSFSKFDTRIIDQPKKLAAWMLGALDETGTKFIWSSVYRKALSDGLENPIKHADDITRKLVAGRGIGEVPILQQAKTMQLIAPFTVEVNNLWKVQKDFLKKKDFVGLAILYMSNNILNDAMEEIRGSGVVFDPIQAIQEGVETEGTFGDKLLRTAGSLAGEVLSNLPLGSSIGSVYPEYGAKVGDIDLPTREQLFGKNDPTRFGIGMPLVKAIQDPVKNLLFPYGGGQVSKTIQGLKTIGVLPQSVATETDEGEKTTEKIKIPASVSKSGRVRTFVKPTLGKSAQAVLFGGYASKEIRDFFNRNGTPYGETQTKNLVELVESGYNPLELDEALTNIRTNGITKKLEKIDSLVKDGFTKKESVEIYNEMWGVSK